MEHIKLKQKCNREAKGATKKHVSATVKNALNAKQASSGTKFKHTLQKSETFMNQLIS